jgi:hypothetical protein
MTLVMTRKGAFTLARAGPATACGKPAEFDPKKDSHMIDQPERLVTPSRALRVLRLAKRAVRTDAAVLSDDPLAAESVQGHLRSAPGIRLAPQGQARVADVVLVITTVLTEQLLDRVKQVREASIAPHQCMALICAPPTERLLALAFRYGVVSLVPREMATRESIVSAVPTLTCPRPPA